MVHAPVTIEVPPKQLINEDRRRLVARLLLLESLDLPVDLPARNAAIGQPGGEF